MTRLGPGPSPIWTRSVQNTCLVCYLRGFNSMSSQPRKRLGSTSKRIALVSNPISPDSKLQPPRAQHHLLGLLAQHFLLQMLFLFHPKRTFDRALYSIKQLQTTATSASEIQPLPLKQFLVTESLKHPPKWFTSRANLHFSSDPLFHCVVVCCFFLTLLAL